MTDPRLLTRRWKATVRRVLARDSGVCVWCGAPATTADHLIARSRGGSDREGNLVAACRSCNSSRGNRVGPPPRLARLMDSDFPELLATSRPRHPRYGT